MPEFSEFTRRQLAGDPEVRKFNSLLVLRQVKADSELRFDAIGR